MAKISAESGFRPLREFQNSTFSYKSQQSFQIVLACQSGKVCMTLKEQHKVFDFHYENDEMMTFKNRAWMENDFGGPIFWIFYFQKHAPIWDMWRV